MPMTPMPGSSKVVTPELMLASVAGATHVGRLPPTLAASDHAAHQDGKIGPHLPPWRDGLTQHLGVPTVGRQNAMGLFASVEDDPVGIGQRRPKRRRPPVDGDQAGGHAAAFGAYVGFNGTRRIEF